MSTKKQQAHSPAAEALEKAPVSLEVVKQIVASQKEVSTLHLEAVTEKISKLKAQLAEEEAREAELRKDLDAMTAFLDQYKG